MQYALLPVIPFGVGSSLEAHLLAVQGLPVFARSPRLPGVIFAFGHGHTGLTMGAITGKLVAELAAGGPTTIDVAPYRPDRF